MDYETAKDILITLGKQEFDPAILKEFFRNLFTNYDVDIYSKRAWKDIGISRRSLAAVSGAGYLNQAMNTEEKVDRVLLMKYADRDLDDVVCERRCKSSPLRR